MWVQHVQLSNMGLGCSGITEILRDTRDFFGHPWFGCAPLFQDLDPYSAVRISVVPKLSSGFRVLVGVPSQVLDTPDLLVYSYFNHRCRSHSPTFRSKWIKTGDGTPIYRAIQWQNFMVFKNHLGFWGANDFWCKAILALALNDRCPMRFAAAWTWEVTCLRTLRLQSCWRGETWGPGWSWKSFEDLKLGNTMVGPPKIWIESRSSHQFPAILGGIP